MLGQIEGIVAPILGLAVLAAARLDSEPSNVRWAIVSGAATGVAAIFKPVFVVVAVAAWMVLAAWRLREKALARYVRAAVIAVAASIVPMALTMLVFGYYGQAGALLYHLTVEPLVLAASEAPHWSNLADALVWSLRFMPGLVGAIGVLWYTGAMNASRLLSFIAAWFAGCVLVIAVQRQSWWTYHFVIFIPLLAVLVSLALQAATKRSDALPSPLIVGLMVLFVLPWKTAIRPMITAVQSRGGGKIDYQTRLADYSGPIAKYLTECEPILALAGRPGSIFVFGDPLIYFLTGTLQGIRLQGFTPEFYNARQWSELKTELSNAELEYIYVARFYDDVIPVRQPQITGLLGSKYENFAKTPDGTWYRRRAPGQGGDGDPRG